MPLDSNHPEPRVSVGILTHNAGTLFHRVLDALHAQETPWPFEVVALDSSSKDGTDRWAADHGARVIPYRPAKFRFGPARDTLFDNCRGSVLVTISQDVVPANPQWLATLVAPILDNRADATVGAQSAPATGHTFYWDYHASWMRTITIRFDQAYGRIAISCANLAIRRDVWAKLRFGDCAIIEDRFLQAKLFKNGYRMMQVNDALSIHGHDYTWKEIDGRIGSFAAGWTELGWPYTLRRMLRDLAQPSRYRMTIQALLQRKLTNWLEVVYPFAMCWIQYRWSRRAQRKMP